MGGGGVKGGHLYDAYSECWVGVGGARTAFLELYLEGGNQNLYLCFAYSSRD